MAANLPYHRFNPRASEVLISASTRGRVYRDAGLLLHWVRAHGSQLIPGHRLGLELGPNDEADLFYQIHPTGTAIARVWVLGIRQENPANPPTASSLYANFPDGNTVTYEPPVATAFGGVVTSKLYLEELTAKSAAEQSLYLNLQQDGGGATVYVDSVSCFELPRAVLSLDASDLGVDLETLRPGAPMYEGTNRSVHGLAQAWAATEVRRHLVNVAFPVVETTSASFVDIFELPIPIVPSKWAPADTTRRVTWRVYAKATDGTTSGEFRITTGNSANTSTVALATGTSTWTSLARGAVAVDCEDPGGTYGEPSGGIDTIQLAFRRTAGSGSIQAAALSAWEADTRAA